MDKLKLYATKKNTVYACLVSGGLTIVMLLMYLSIGNFSGSDFSSLGSLFSSIKTLCYLYYVNILVLIVIVGTLLYRFLKMNDKTLSTKITLACDGVSLLFAILCFSGVSAIKGVVSGDLSSIFTMGSDATSFDGYGTFLLIMILTGLAGACSAAYFMFVKKETEETSSSTTDQENAQTQSMKDLMAKFKTYYATENGKKRIRIGGISIVSVLVLVVGFNIYQSMKRTPIDLTSNCSLKYTGVSGKGRAKIDCNVDYDKTDMKVATFMNTVTYEVENNETLANEDKAVLVAKYSEETADGSKVKVENASKEFTVEGLEVVYLKYAEIPADVTTALQQKAADAIKKTTEKSYSFSSSTTTLKSADLIGTYYEYENYSNSGILHYLYRTLVEKNSEYSNSQEYDYYDVRIKSVSSKTKLEEYSANVDSIYLSGDDKTDAEAVKSLKQYRDGLEVVSETLSTDTYTDTRTTK